MAWGILDIFGLYGVRAGQTLMRNYVLREFLRYSDVRMRDFIAGLQYADERDWIIAPLPNVLRLTEEGISSRAFRSRFGASLEAVFGDEVGELVALGLLERIDEDGRPMGSGNPADYRLRLTDRGHLLGNQVFLRFVDG